MIFIPTSLLSKLTGVGVAGHSGTGGVATTLGDASKINSVWTWNKTASKWAFYAPSMTSSELSAYALSKGYDVLSSIASKQGFWVNAAIAFSVTSPWNNNAVLAAGDFKIGWNLVGGAGTTTPSQLNQSLQASLNGIGQDITNSVYRTPQRCLPMARQLAGVR